MYLKKNYDVVIIGSGPAGASLAYGLADAGISVLVIEKSRFPRYKCCGGGITFKAAGLLTPEVQGVFENEIFSVRMAFPGDLPFNKVTEQPIVYTVMRSKFDHALAKQAKAAGAYFTQGHPVEKIVLNDDFAEIFTDKNSFRSKFLVGADGANGITARELGIKTQNSSIIAIESEVRVPHYELTKWKSQLMLEIGRVPAGYAWVFPKADHLSIGIGCLPHGPVNLKRLYREFLNSLGFKLHTIERFGSAFIPVCKGEPSVNKGRAMLVGDAAGLSDPLTGEGIYNALLSSRLASSVIKKALRTNNADLSEYADLISEKITSEMKVANSFFRLLASSPHRLFEIIENEDGIWKNCCDLLRGVKKYTEIKGIFPRVVIVN